MERALNGGPVDHFGRTPDNVCRYCRLNTRIGVCQISSGSPLLWGLSRTPSGPAAEGSQSDTDLSGIIFGEANSGFLRSFLYFEDRGEMSFHDSVVLFDALQSCWADPRDKNGARHPPSHRSSAILRQFSTRWQRLGLIGGRGLRQSPTRTRWPTRARPRPDDGLTPTLLVDDRGTVDTAADVDLPNTI